MAVQKELLTRKIGTRMATGVVDGKEVLRTRSYGNVGEDATDQAIYDVGAAIAALQVGTLEEILLTESHLLMNV